MNPAAETYRLIYRSRNATGGAGGGGGELETLVAASQARNARSGLTGALLLVGGTFLQALEGPRLPLEATFERICCDLRHREVELIEYALAGERAFGDWSLHALQPDAHVAPLLQAVQAPAGCKDSRALSETLRLFMSMVAIEQGRARRMDGACAASAVG